MSQAREDARGMRHRRRTCSEEGRRRVPTWERNRGTTMGEEDGEDGLRRPQSTAEGGASGGAEPWAPSPRWRAGDGEPKATHVPLWVAPGEPGGHPRARSPPGSKIGLQCSERGRSGYLRTELIRRKPWAMAYCHTPCGIRLLGHVEPFTGQMSSGWGSLGSALAGVPGRRSLGGDPEGGVSRGRPKC